jgi:hypothetical protein
MQKELGETLLKVISGGKLDGASILLVKIDGNAYSLGILSNSHLNKFLTFNPTIKDKSFLVFGMSGNLKHITLVDLKKWHITCRENNDKKFPKRLNKKTFKISDNLTHWFGLSIKNLDNLTQIADFDSKKETFQMDYTGIPPSDSDRRLANLTELLQSNLEYGLIKLENKYKDEEHYYHFEFYICNKKTEVEDIGIFSPVIEAGVKIPINIFNVKTVNILDKDIIMVSAQVPGVIREPVRVWFNK